MEENKVNQLLEQVEDQLDMLHQDFTTAQTEKVRFELDHANGYTEEEKIKLNQLDSRESYIYDQIFLFNDIRDQLEVLLVVSRELGINSDNFIDKIESFKSLL